MQDPSLFFIPIFMNFFRFFVMAGIPFLIFYIWFPSYFSRHKIQDRVAKHKDFVRELIHSLKTILVFITAGILILHAPFGANSIPFRESVSYPFWWVPVSIFLALVLHDTYFYWVHRAMHSKSVFRWTHAIHHRSTNPTPLASYSFNLIEAILEALGAAIIVLLVPMNLSTLLFTTLLIFAFNVYAHLGYEILPRWFRYSILFECLVTSVHHNMHHRKSKGNYAVYFRFWDRLMQTEFTDYVETYDQVQAKRFAH